MERQAEGTVPHEEIQDENFSVDTNSFDNTKEGPVMRKISRCGAHAATNDDIIQGEGSEFFHSVQHDQNETMNESKRIKLRMTMRIRVRARMRVRMRARKNPGMRIRLTMRV